MSGRERRSSSRRSAAQAPAGQEALTGAGGAAEGEGNYDAGDPQGDAPMQAPRPAVPVGRSLEISTTPDVCMESLVDKLKLLDYDREFCRKKKPHRKPLTRLYFALPDPSAAANQQFFYFTSLATWLVNLVGVELSSPKEFDDPNTTCANILGACKKLGFAAPSYHPSKLTVGHGREICGVLDGVADYVLERRNFAYKKPMYLPDTFGIDAAGEDDEDMGGGDGDEEAATTFELPNSLEEDEEEAYMQEAPDLNAASAAGARREAGPGRAAQEDKAPVTSRVDPTAWRMEVERVAPRLRITLNANAKDWRSHLEEVQAHTKSITSTWPSSRAVLERLRSELELSLDKLSTRERFLNDQFDTLMSQYRATRSQMQGVQASYNTRNEGISDRNSELRRITEQLAEMKGVMDGHSTNIADATPVMRIKGAIKTLTQELAEVEVRIGVVSHTLLQLSVKDRRAGGQAKVAAHLSDDEDNDL